jgi:catechol 2,3-dioxygenase-like lactoylglutathione lyase family enzyme
MTIDHVEILVPDREAAREWYGRWLGFKEMPEHGDWVETGPIMLTNDGGATKLALFTGESSGAETVQRGWRRVAFRVSGQELLDWAAEYRASGQKLVGPVDHKRAWSGYFSDPWGNALEVTTDDYDVVRQAGEGAK